jgi:hypothetical protein
MFRLWILELCDIMCAGRAYQSLIATLLALVLF